MTIDYSKWDHIILSSSDEEDNSYDENIASTYKSGKVNVTQFKKQSSVTIEKENITINPSPTPIPQSQQVISFNPSNDPLSQDAANSNFENDAKCNSGVLEEGICGVNFEEINAQGVTASKLVDDEDCFYTSLKQHGAEVPDSHLWSQTRESITVSLILPRLDIKGCDIAKFLISETISQSNGQAPSSHLYVSLANGEEIIDKDFIFPVVADEEALVGCWELHTLQKRKMRIIKFTLQKKLLCDYIHRWWKKCFISDVVTADLENIDKENPKRISSNKIFQENWKAAHEQFRKKIKENKKCVVPDDSF